MNKTAGANAVKEEILYADEYRNIQKEFGTYSTLQKLACDINPDARVISTPMTCKCGKCDKVEVKGIQIRAGLTGSRHLETVSTSANDAAEELLERLLKPEDEFKCRNARAKARIYAGSPKAPKRIIRVVQHREKALTA